MALIAVKAPTDLAISAVLMTFSLTSSYFASFVCTQRTLLKTVKGCIKHMEWHILKNILAIEMEFCAITQKINLPVALNDQFEQIFKMRVDGGSYSDPT